MLSLSYLVPQLQALFTSEADRLAQELKLIQRQRQLSGATLAQTLVFGWLQNPDAPLSQLVQMAAALGVTLSEQGLAKRFTFTCAAFFKQLLLLACQRAFHSPHTPELFDRFSAVFILDSSVVMLPKALREHWPGCGGNQGGNAGLKLHAGLDLKGGQLTLELGAAKAHDQTSSLATQPLAPGSLRIADLGYYSFKQLKAYQDQGVGWLTRFKADGCWWDSQGQQINILEALARTREQAVEWQGFLGKERIPARLLAYRVSPDQESARRFKVLEKARRKGRPVSQARLALSGWTLLVTNVPDLSLEEAFELYRVRWQIELLFKLWKQQGKVDEWRSESPSRILCEVYAKLIGLLIQHWACLGELWSDLRRSLVKAGRAVRSHALTLACALTDRTQLERALAQLHRSLRSGCKVNTRLKNPSTWQTLQVLGETLS